MSTSSALIGDPPNTQNDWFIIKGMYRAVGEEDADPNEGYTLLPGKPDHEVAPSKQAGIIIGMAVVIFVMLTVTFLRLSVRFFKTKLRFGLDDWMIIPAVILAVSYPCLQIDMVVRGGGGKHTWDVTYEEYASFNTDGASCKIIFYVAVGMIKISITLFNRRLTGLSSKAWRVFCDVLLVLCIAYTLLALFWQLFQCSPPRSTWDLVYNDMKTGPTKCDDTFNISQVLSVIHVVLDFVLLATPVAIIWKVKMDFSKKVRMCIVWATGGLSVVGSVLREVEQSTLSPDIMYSYTGILGFTLMDLTLGVVVASMPVLSSLLPAAWRSVSGKVSSSRYGSGQHTLGSTAGPSTIKSSRTRVQEHEGNRDSEENGIMREDAIELSYQARGSMDKQSGGTEIEGQNHFYGERHDRDHPAMWRP